MVDVNSSKQEVIQAVTSDGWLLAGASKKLQDDELVVLTAVAQEGWAFEYASDRLRKDKSFTLAAVKQSGSALRYASEDLRNDEEIVLAAIESDKNAFKYASEELRNNKNFVFKAIEKNILALKYASEELRNDRDFVLEVLIYQDKSAINFASSYLQNDPFLLRALKHDISVFSKLLPLKKQLELEINPEIREVVKTMISTIEENILTYLEITAYLTEDDNVEEIKEGFKSNLEYAFKMAKPTLEKNDGWKALINRCFNSILSFFMNRNEIQDQSSRFFFFKESTPLIEKSKVAENEIITELKIK